MILTGSAEGSCNSREKKYRYRQQERTCPNCGKATIIKGKAEYGGGWVCFAKKGGCGAKFSDDAKAITDQQVGQILNPDIPELANTILKMAEKRALVAAALIVTGASDYFTQDVEDYIDGDYQSQPAHAQQPQPAPSNIAGPDAWAKWYELVTEAAPLGITVYEPADNCTVDELRAAYGKLSKEIKAVRAASEHDAQAQ